MAGDAGGRRFIDDPAGEIRSEDAGRLDVRYLDLAPVRPRLSAAAICDSRPRCSGVMGSWLYSLIRPVALVPMPPLASRLISLCPPPTI